MKKYIYKITNTVNGKMYIGQTNNYIRRFNEHKNPNNWDREQSKVLYQAFKKYGIQNFTFEVIEETSNYNEQEKFWIQKLNTLVPFGYNMSEGGETPPITKGEASIYATHTQEEIQQIQYLLQFTNKSTAEIGKMFDYDDTAIQRINIGAIWYDENIGYPIRHNTKKDGELRALNIIHDLLYSSLTQKEIAKKYNVARTTVTAINNGANHKQDKYKYPLRKTDSIMGKEKKAIAQYTLDGELVQVFESGAAAANALNLTTSSGIRACANGKMKTAYGYVWKFL